jgi:FtsP/CotA-like multicopper oxidase with cupredoxin domain
MEKYRKTDRCERSRTMKRRIRCSFMILPLLLMIFVVMPSEGAVFVQCPGDINGDGISDDPKIVCKHIAAGDGFIKMADGRDMYMFGFTDVTGTPSNQVMETAMLGMEFAAPTITVKEGQEFYLTLTNVGMAIRPDLFDPHSVHWHGFPNAASVFDGEPMASAPINMGASFTYYYNVVESGTFMYHCHVEATEHMQMGMLGNLYVTPLQNDLPDGTNLSGFIHHTGYKYAYNDGDGSTYYDVTYPIQIHAFDPNFHDANESVQPLPFAAMKDTYPMLNGRGYPDTVNTNNILNKNGYPAQKLPSLITASKGQKILLRISSLATVDFYSLRVLGIPIKVVGKDAKLLRGPTGNLYYDTNSVILGGGESIDVILDTTDVPTGTYFLYTTNLYNLSNDAEDFGGMMTEIVIN